MVTVKDLAKQAGLSPTTVSLVLRGKGDQQGISKATQQKIWDLARELGYRPNISARRLRSSETETIYVAIYWTLDYRSAFMTRFINGLREKAEALGQKIEWIIKPYTSLRQSFEANAFYHAAIVCNAAPDDIQYLETLPHMMPIILYNRLSAHFSSVGIDYQKMGEQAADILAEAGVRYAAVLTDQSTGNLSMRDLLFMEALEKKGLSPERFHAAPRHFHATVESVLSHDPMIDGIFCVSSYLSISFLNRLLQKGKRIPQDCHLLGIGSGEQLLEEYAVVPISVLQVQREFMAGRCLELLLEQLKNPSASITHELYAPLYIQRESC